MLVRSKALAVRVQTLANRSFLPLSQTGQCLFGPSFQDRFLATDLFLETVLFLSWSPTSGLTAVARNSQEDLLGCPKGARSGLEDHVIRPIPTPFKSIKNPDVVLTLARPNIGFWVSIVSMTSIPFDHLGSSNHIPSPTPPTSRSGRDIRPPLKSDPATWRGGHRTLLLVTEWMDRGVLSQLLHESQEQQWMDRGSVHVVAHGVTRYHVWKMPRHSTGLPHMPISSRHSHDPSFQDHVNDGLAGFVV